MPLYLVRWPGLEASIVRANDEEHLTDILDEVGDPGAASWDEYDGPLWVDVDVGIEAERGESDDKWTLRGVEDAAEKPWAGANVQRGESETAEEMLGAVFEGAFPNLSRLISKTETEGLDPNALRRAARLDLVEHEPSGVAPAYVDAMAQKRRGKGGNGGN
jgi:hypothetical protein